MKNLFKLLWISLLWATSCGEEAFQSLTSDSAPGQISVIRTENGPGKARIYYNLPASESLLYIEATYEDKEETYTTKASGYKNYIDLEGFSAARPYEIKLYSVSRGLNKSAPVVIQVDPETPPYLVTYGQATAVPDFGGLNINFENPTGAALVVYVEKKNEEGDWLPLDAFYSQEQSQQLSIRNQPPVEQEFRLRIRDKFKNYSDYKQFTLTPWLEAEMDYSQFVGYPLPNDPRLFVDVGLPPQPHRYLWNQIYVGTPSTSGGWVGTENATYPQHTITFDVGKATKFTRLVIYQRGLTDQTTLVYASANLKIFELWGANDPNPDGSWTSWTKILDGDIIKPAGSTTENLEIARRGHDFSISQEHPPFRYLRIKEVATFSVTGNSRFFLGGIRLFENVVF